MDDDDLYLRVVVVTAYDDVMMLASPFCNDVPWRVVGMFDVWMVHDDAAAGT